MNGKNAWWKRIVSMLLVVAMVTQSCVTTIAEQSVVPATETEQSADAQAAAAQKAAEEAAKKEAEAAAQKEAEAEAAQKAAAQSEAESKAAADAAAQSEAESKAAADAAAQSEAESKAASDAAAQSEAESKAAADAAAQSEAESKAAADAAKKETEAKTETNKKETEKKEVTYRVTFEAKAAEHGTITVETVPVAVSTYYKDVKENTSFTFTVKAAEGYAVDKVKVDNIDVPTTANANEYKIAAVNKNTQIVVTYKELPKETAEEETEEGTEAETGTEEETEEDSEPESETELETEIDTELESESETEDAVLNKVTFEIAEGATVTVDGEAVTSEANAKDGSIVFEVAVAEGYELTSVVVDGTKDARLNEATEAENDYIIEGIKTDETVVTVSAAEVETEAPAMPEQTFEGTAGDVTVTVYAPEGAFPEGTTMQVAPVAAETVIAAVEDQIAAEGKEIVDVVAVDITFRDKDGYEIQPAAEVQVSLGNVAVSEEANEAEIYHVDDAANAEAIAEVAPDAEEAVFPAESFSIYARVATAEADSGISLLTDNPDTVEVEKEITLTADTSRTNGTWSITSGDEYVVITQTSGNSATIRGIATSGSSFATIQYRYTNGWGYTSETFNVTVTGTPTTSYTLYCYTLIPGKNIDDNTNADTRWNGVGYGSVVGLNAPSSYVSGNTNLMGDGVTITYPTSYPDLTIDNVTYKYAATGSAEATQKGYYTIEWIRIVRSGGVNAGNNNYFTVIDSSVPTFHLDGQIFINEENYYNVTFRIKKTRNKYI